MKTTIKLANGKKGQLRQFGWWSAPEEEGDSYVFTIRPINKKADEARLRIWKKGFILYSEWEEVQWPEDMPWQYSLDCPVTNLSQVKREILELGLFDEEQERRYKKFVGIK